MIRRKTHAEFLLERASNYREQGAIELSKSTAISAQALATLLLVEQQRIANLIALSTAATQGIRTDLGLFERRDGQSLTEPPSWHLLPDIAKALGLEDGATI